MQEIINLYQWFDDYTKKLVGRLYYERSLENGKDFKGVRKVQTDCSINGAMQQQNNVQPH